MSKPDIRRYELLHQVIGGKRSLRQITEALGVSYRQAKRLKAQVVALGGENGAMAKPTKHQAILLPRLGVALPAPLKRHDV